MRRMSLSPYLNIPEMKRMKRGQRITMNGAEALSRFFGTENGICARIQITERSTELTTMSTTRSF